MRQRKFFAFFLVLFVSFFWSYGSTKPLGADPQSKAPAQKKPAQEEKDEKPKIKPYEEVITKEAKSDEGLSTVHMVDEKLYYEIPSSLLEREMLLVSRIAKTATGLGYGGEKSNTQVVRWQRHGNKILLRIVTYVNVADENFPIFQAVQNANLEPIAMKFDMG